MELRPYQTKCISAMADAIERKVTRQLIVMATGLGKTLTVSAFHAARNQPRLFGLMHREELLSQAHARFTDTSPGIRVGIEKADRGAAPDDQVILASVQTVGRSDGKRLSLIAPDWPSIVWVDEVHHAPAASYLNVLDHFGLYGDPPPNQERIAIGTTATPERLDKLGYDKIFDDVVFRYGLRDGIKDGWLADIRAWQVKSDIDLSGVRIRNGDFVEKELDALINTKQHNQEVARLWAERSSGRFWSRSLFFCVTKNHAHQVAAALKEAGAKAAVVVDDTPKDERKVAIEGLRSGRLQALVNVGIFTEGFDLPEIDTIHIVRPTKSQALYTQMIGRGTRKADGKECLDLVDHIGHGHDVCSIGRIFGLPDAWDLDGSSVTKDAEELEEAVEDLGISVDGLTSMKDLGVALQSRTRRMHLIKSSLVGADIPSALFWIQPSRAEERYVISWRNETQYQIDKMPFEYQFEATEVIQKANLFGVAERIEVFQNELGKYEGKIFRRKGGETITHPMGSDASLAKLIGRLENWIEAKRSHKTWLLDKKAKWGRDSASNKQVGLLQRRGVSEGFLADLTKREASILIDLPVARLRTLFGTKER